MGFRFANDNSSHQALLDRLDAFDAKLDIMADESGMDKGEVILELAQNFTDRRLAGHFMGFGGRDKTV